MGMHFHAASINERQLSETYTVTLFKMAPFVPLACLGRKICPQIENMIFLQCQYRNELGLEMTAALK